MRKKNKLFLLIAFFVSILIFVTISFIFSKMHTDRNDLYKFTSSYDEAINKLSNNVRTCSFDSYFKIIRAEYIILPDESKVQQSLVFENITGQPISFNYQIYKEQELVDKYISSVVPAMPPNEIPIDLLSGSRAVTNMASECLYIYEEFSEIDKQNIDRLAGTLYLEIGIGENFDLFQVHLTKVDTFTEY